MIRRLVVRVGRHAARRPPRAVHALGAAVVSVLIAGPGASFAEPAPASGEPSSAVQSAREVGRAVGLTFRQIGHGARDIGVEIGHGARDIGVEIGRGARDVGVEIGRGAAKAGREVGQAAREGGKSFSRAIRGE